MSLSVTNVRDTVASQTGVVVARSVCTVQAGTTVGGVQEVVS